MALLHAVNHKSQQHLKVGTGNSFAGPACFSFEASRASGEKSMVSNFFPFSPLNMKRYNLFQDLTTVKKVKLEPSDGEHSAHYVDHGLPHIIHNVDHELPHSVGTIERSTSGQWGQEVDLPSDFLEPLSPERLPDENSSFSCKPSSLQQSTPSVDNDFSFSCEQASLQMSPQSNDNVCYKGKAKPSRQFWKAGDYEGDVDGHKSTSGGMDHVRVHPKFLHSNATSHKWALGAIAELLDNALDEAPRGATFVNIDTIPQPKEGSPMLLIEDDGGGMNPECIRSCMSLGYSVKSKMANTIGQYGNGFKTSTMRLGADVIVFSRSPSRDGCKPTQSIGILSYSFLRETGQQDIIVPMVDFEIQASGLKKLIRSNVDDWKNNMDTLTRWSPFATENELLDQFEGMGLQGTRIVVYNLWENDQGQLELDFDTDNCDIQVRGVNRDTKRMALVERLPNSRHFLTYRHSLRTYASILYLRLPKNFRMILRGLEIKHHSLVSDLMIIQKVPYRPQAGPQQEEEQEHAHLQDGSQMSTVVTVGFVKDAKEHADVQGFNVYHKNRLIKPFWRIWNSAGSHGRGIIGVLEANFVEPAHDKQGFERTSVLARLEARLLKMQKTYWSNHSHKVGYYNHQMMKKKQLKASGANAGAMEDTKTGTSFPQTERQKVLKGLACQSQDCSAIVPLAFPRSSRSRRRRKPARRFQNAPPSGTCTALSQISRDGFQDADAFGASERNELSKHDSLEHLKSTSDQLAAQACSLDEMGHSSIAWKTGLRNSNADTVAQSIPSEYISLVADAQNVPPEEENSMIPYQAFKAEVMKRRNLELQLADMKQQMEVMQRKMEKAMKERAIMMQELEEERKHVALNDAELRKKLRDTNLRVRELELLTNKLQSAGQQVL